MFAYFDTAAMVPMLIDETGTAEAGRLWRAADVVVGTRLLHVETAAALRRALSARRIDSTTFDEALKTFESYWHEIQIMELDESLMRHAASMAIRFGLRGYDATHCAAAHIMASDDTVAVSGGRSLLDAWRELGLATAHV